MSPPGSRREARERILSMLYEAESKGRSPVEILGEQVLQQDPFIVSVLRGVTEHRAELDGLIARHAKGWTVDRMPAIDRAVLRVGVWELVHAPETPVAAVINEAVELAKIFSTEDSGRYVNGVLSAVARALPTRSEPT